MSLPVTAVVFDIGGVLIDWDPEHLYGKLIPDRGQRHRFLTEICTPAWNRTMDAGRPVPEGVASLAGDYPEFAELIHAWWSRWPEMLGGEVPGTRAIAERIAATGLPIYALTNWSAETWPLGVGRFPFLAELFDGIVVSGHEQVAKPDPEIFEILDHRYDLDPTSTVYIDDSPANIETAVNLGFLAHNFTTAGNLDGWLGEVIHGWQNKPV